MNWMDGCFFSFIQVSVRVHSFTNIFGKTGLVLQESSCSLGNYQIPINFPQLICFYFHSPFPQKKKKKKRPLRIALCHCEAQQLRFGSLTISFSLISELGFRLFSGQTEERNWKGTWGPPFFFLVACFLRKWESLFSQ